MRAFRWLVGGRGYRRLSSPQTDLQARLRHIEGRCEQLEKEAASPEVRQLAYLVGYIAKITEIHFQSGEG